MPGIKILGTGSYSPQFTLTNKMLEDIVETDDGWITLRTGITSRRIAATGETALSMAVNAANFALKQCDRSKIGAVIVATVTPDYITPSMSCLLQRELELPGDVLALDINCACAGFTVALRTAYGLLGGMPGRTALILGVDMLSRVTDYTDRATCILFGDGAGAALVELDPDGAFVFDCGARGDDEILTIKPGYHCNNPYMPRPGDTVAEGIKMNGTEVFRFAIETCSESVTRVLNQAGVSAADVDHFIFHQANRRIIDGIIRKLGVPIEKCLINIECHGNTSSATCAIALDELLRSGKVKPGDKIVISAFGGGLIYASAYFVQN